MPLLRSPKISRSGHLQPQKALISPSPCPLFFHLPAWSLWPLHAAVGPLRLWRLPSKPLGPYFCLSIWPSKPRLVLPPPSMWRTHTCEGRGLCLVRPQSYTPITIKSRPVGRLSNESASPSQSLLLSYNAPLWTLQKISCTRVAVTILFTCLTIELGDLRPSLPTRT
jgi:hypothetical protein